MAGCVSKGEVGREEGRNQAATHGTSGNARSAWGPEVAGGLFPQHTFLLPDFSSCCYFYSPCPRRFGKQPFCCFQSLSPVYFLHLSSQEAGYTRQTLSQPGPEDPSLGVKAPTPRAPSEQPEAGRGCPKLLGGGLFLTLQKTQECPLRFFSRC